MKLGIDPTNSNIHLEGSVNPRDIKMKLAFEIVWMYHSREDVDGAQDYFVRAFTQKEIPLYTVI